MQHQVLWALDCEIEARAYERLCTDLLYRNGYRDIVPIEPQDNGRDAEEFPRAGRGRAGESCFFQFSMEGDWKAKVRRDVKKLIKGRFNPNYFVFVTSRKARGVDVDKLRNEFRENYNIELIVFSREWLRLQLEEAHPDLAQKYLNLDVSLQPTRFSKIIALKKPPDTVLALAWDAINAGAFERAAVELKEYLKDNPESSDAWSGLAWSQYNCRRYDEALDSVIKAVKLSSDTIERRAIRGCILAEKGTETNDRSTLMVAKREFESILNDVGTVNWTVFYNLGNISAALGDHNEAIDFYQKSLEKAPDETQTLKNLATSLHHVGKHTEEMECLDRVLELEPNKPEALVSKAVTLLTVFKNSTEAVAILERAIKTDYEWAVAWPHIWYWIGYASIEANQFSQALEWLNDGLAHQPGNIALKRLKSKVLSQLLDRGMDVDGDARAFWSNCISDEPLDYDSRFHLGNLEWKQGRIDSAWSLIQACFKTIGINCDTEIKHGPFHYKDCLTAFSYLPQYKRYRDRFLLEDYWNVDDPLYDLPFKPPFQSPEFTSALTVFLSIPFGLGLNSLECTEGEKCRKEALLPMYNSVRSNVVRAISGAASCLRKSVVENQSDPDSFASFMSEVLLFIGLLSLREFSRQRGWIASQFYVTAEKINNEMDTYDETQIEKDVISSTLEIFKDELKIPRKDEST